MKHILTRPLSKIQLSVKKLYYSKLLNKYKDQNYFTKPIPTHFDQFAGANRRCLDHINKTTKDSKAKKRFGATSQKDFNYWSWRACAIVGVQMAIATLTPNKSITTMKLINEALKYKGYNIPTDTGWYHHSLVSIAKDYGLKAKIASWMPIEELAINIIQNNNLCLVSVDVSKGGHMILIYGVKLADGKVKGVYYHDPSPYYNKKGKSVYVSSNKFLQIYKNRGVVIGKSYE